MHLRYELLLNSVVIICTVLLVAVPLLIRYLNQYLHDYGDPTWKHDSGQQEEERNEQ